MPAVDFTNFSMSPTLSEEDHALSEETVPHHLRSLFVLRIVLCTGAAGLALGKILLSPPLVNFFLDLLSDYGPGWPALLRAANLVVSGTLAVFLALVVMTYLLQARLQAEVEREILTAAGAAAAAATAAEARSSDSARAK